MNTDASILVYKFRPENWFQCLRRVYATAINFPCIITLPKVLSVFTGEFQKSSISDREQLSFYVKSIN